MLLQLVLKLPVRLEEEQRSKQRPPVVQWSRTLDEGQVPTLLRPPETSW